MTVTVCKHGNQIDIEWLPAERGAGFYRQTLRMPMCKECILEAAMDAMEQQTEPFDRKL